MELVNGTETKEQIEQVRNKMEKDEFGEVMYRMHIRMQHEGIRIGPMLEDLNTAYTLLLKETMNLALNKSEGELLIKQYTESTKEVIAILNDLKKETNTSPTSLDGIDINQERGKS